MGFHTFDVDRAEQLEDPTRFAYVSVDELLSLFDARPDDVVADLGSGTGFYTDEVAPHVGRVLAVDVQRAMHDLYREKGVPPTVDLVTGAVGPLPLATDSLDAAFSTMTFHEFATAEALSDLRRVLGTGGRLAIADWTAAGTAETGPPLGERFTVDEAAERLESAGFSVTRRDERRETFVVGAVVG